MGKPDYTHVNRCRAFAFYATNDQYAIAVMVFVHQLRKIGLVEDADIVVLHLPLSSRVLGGMHRMGIVTSLVSDVPRAYGHYYQYSLLKLKILGLTRYDLVIYVDADAIPLKPLELLEQRASPSSAPRA